MEVGRKKLIGIRYLRGQNYWSLTEFCYMRRYNQLVNSLRVRWVEASCLLIEGCILRMSRHILHLANGGPSKAAHH